MENETLKENDQDSAAAKSRSMAGPAARLKQQMGEPDEGTKEPVVEAT